MSESHPLLLCNPEAIQVDNVGHFDLELTHNGQLEMKLLVCVRDETKEQAESAYSLDKVDCDDDDCNTTLLILPDRLLQLGYFLGIANSTA